jgi:hypothetical protein
MDKAVPLILPWDETFDIASDTGTPGSPDVTTTIDGRYLPPQSFKGGFDLHQSTDHSMGSILQLIRELCRAGATNGSASIYENQSQHARRREPPRP